MYEPVRQNLSSAEEELARAIACMGTAEFLPAALDYLRSNAAFVGVLLLLLEGDGRPFHIFDNVRAERRFDIIDRYLDGAYLLDPFFEAYRSDKSCRLLQLREIAPDRFVQSSYFKRYYKDTGLQDELAIFIDLPRNRTLFYSIGRRATEMRFTRDEVQSMRRVLPVFAALNRRHFGMSDYATLGGQPIMRNAEVVSAMEGFASDSLTVREQEISTLILKGHSSKSIARLIGISPGTVKIHRKNIYRKLDISSQSELFTLFLGSLAA